MRNLRPIRALTLGLTMSAALVTTAVAPASAASSSCAITYLSCQTGTIPANASGHFIVLSVAPPDAGTVSCTVHDAYSGIAEGSLSRGYRDQPRSIKIPNLYGRYFAVCVNTRNSGAGAIQNS